MKTMNKSEMRAYVISKLVGGVKLIAATKVVPVKAEQVTSEGILKNVLANGFVEAEGTKLNVGDWILTNPKGEQYKNDDPISRLIMFLLQLLVKECIVRKVVQRSCSSKAMRISLSRLLGVRRQFSAEDTSE